MSGFDNFTSLDDLDDIQARKDRQYVEQGEAYLRRHGITQPPGRPHFPEDHFVTADDQRDIINYEVHHGVGEAKARLAAYEERETAGRREEERLRLTVPRENKKVPTIEETIEFIKKAHAGQTDKSGEEYWKHPYAVMQRLPEDMDHDVLKAALLHDVIEDTPYTKNDLLAMGYSQRTVDIVCALTKNKDDERSYGENIDALIGSQDRDVILIKYADMSENLDPERLSKLPSEMSKKLTDKYKGPHAKLQKAVMALASTPAFPSHPAVSFSCASGPAKDPM